MTPARHDVSNRMPVGGMRATAPTHNVCIRGRECAGCGARKCATCNRIVCGVVVNRRDRCARCAFEPRAVVRDEPPVTPRLVLDEQRSWVFADGSAVRFVMQGE